MTISKSETKSLWKVSLWKMLYQALCANYDFSHPTIKEIAQHMWIINVYIFKLDINLRRHGTEIDDLAVSRESGRVVWGVCGGGSFPFASWVWSSGRGPVGCTNCFTSCGRFAPILMIGCPRVGDFCKFLQNSSTVSKPHIIFHSEGHFAMRKLGVFIQNFRNFVTVNETVRPR